METYVNEPRELDRESMAAMPVACQAPRKSAILSAIETLDSSVANLEKLTHKLEEMLSPALKDNCSPVDNRVTVAVNEGASPLCHRVQFLANSTDDIYHRIDLIMSRIEL